MREDLAFFASSTASAFVMPSGLLDAAGAGAGAGAGFAAIGVGVGVGAGAGAAAFFDAAALGLIVDADGNPSAGIPLASFAASLRAARFTIVLSLTTSPPAICLSSAAASARTSTDFALRASRSAARFSSCFTERGTIVVASRRDVAVRAGDVIVGLARRVVARATRATTRGARADAAAAAGTRIGVDAIVSAIARA